MKVVVLGGSGQVGAEVVLRMAGIAGIAVWPVARARGGSAFLRHNGISVVHGDISDAEDARRLLAGANVIANFALPIGARSIAADRIIIENTFRYSSKTSTIVFFSTHSVHGGYDGARRIKEFYGTMKRRSERLVLRLAARHKRNVYVLRLGHVAGTLQRFTALCREELLSPPVVVADPDRRSNVTHTVTIADALVKIAHGEAGVPGLYDLVDVPGWTWREIYAFEAHALGVPLQMVRATSTVTAASTDFSMCGAAVRLAKAMRLKELGMTALSFLPARYAATAHCEYALANVRSDLAPLLRDQSCRNPAVLWPALEVRPLPGIRSAFDLLADGAFAIEAHATRKWPADLDQ